MLLTCGITFKAKSQRQPTDFPKIKVAIHVDCEGWQTKAIVENELRNGLRNMKDVSIVGDDFENSLWDHMIIVPNNGIKISRRAKIR